MEAMVVPVLQSIAIVTSHCDIQGALLAAMQDTEKR